MFVFPVSKQMSLKKLPWVTLALILLNFIIFFMTWTDTLDKSRQNNAMRYYYLLTGYDVINQRYYHAYRNAAEGGRRDHT